VTTKPAKRASKDTAATKRPPRGLFRRTGRVLGFGIAAAMLTVSVAMMNIVVDRIDARIDVTATGEHRLSPRTQGLLDSLPGPIEIVVATDRGSLDRRVIERVDDTLASITRAREDVSVTVIDLTASDGQARYLALLERLADADRELVDTQARIIQASLDTADGSSAWLGDLSARLGQISAALGTDSAALRTNAAAIEQRAGLARIMARQLTELAQAEQAVIDTPMEPIGLPDIRGARDRTRRALDGYEQQLTQLQLELSQLSNAPTTPAAAVDRLDALTGAIAEERERIAIAIDPLKRLVVPSVLRVGDALRGSQAVLVIEESSRAITAIDPDELFGTLTARLERAGLRDGGVVARNAEDLFAAAFASLSPTRPPIVCLTHAELGEGLIDAPGFKELTTRLRVRGVDVIEWAVSTGDRPDTIAIDPTGTRPVVYIVLANDATQGVGVPERSGSARAAQLGAVLNTLLDERSPVMVCLMPSILPTYGDIDPIASPLERFGLETDTGRPLLRNEPGSGPATVSVRTDMVSVAQTGDEAHPLRSAMAGLPTQLWWTVPVSIDLDGTPPGVTITELLTVPADPSVWLERDWINLWQTPAAQRGIMPNPPQPGGSGDSQAGPWTAAVAIETEPRATGMAPHRVVVVGSAGWIRDEVTQQVDQVDGRLVMRAPGNAELIESGLAWLAGRDELVGRGSGAQAVARIPSMSAQQISTIRWIILGALPLSLLMLGISWRLIRG
jgi:hypothetical protein